MSKASFMVRIRPLRIRSEEDVATEAQSPQSRAPSYTVCFSVFFVPSWRREGGSHFIESSPASRPAILPCLTAISSARMLTAISCGVTAPISRQIGRQLIRDELIVDARDFRPAADETEVTELTRCQRPQRLEIVRVAARHDDRVPVHGKSGPGDPRRDVLDDHLDGVRKPLGVGELLAVVDHVHAEADFVSDTSEVKADVTGADDIELGRRLDRLDIDIHLTAANQTGFLGEIVVELVVNELGSPARDRFAGLPERVVLVAPAADGADDPAVTEDEHFGADPLRGRTSRRHDRHQRRRLAAVERLGHSREDFLVHSGNYKGSTGGKGRKGGKGEAIFYGPAAPACPASPVRPASADRPA